MRVYIEGFRTPYTNPPPRLVVDNFEPSLTQQHFKDECDINNIMRRYRETGLFPDPLSAKPLFGDFSSCFDFMEAQNTVARANEAFAALPSEIRKRFANDPAQLLAFMEDERNMDEAVKLGLVEKPPTAVETPAQPVSSEGTATT